MEDVKLRLEVVRIVNLKHYFLSFKKGFLSFIPYLSRLKCEALINVGLCYSCSSSLRFFTLGKKKLNMLKLNLCVVKRSLAFPRLKPKIICQALHSKAFIVPHWYFLLFPFAKISEILFTRAGKYNLHFENKMMKYFGQRERSKRLYITHPAFSQNLQLKQLKYSPTFYSNNDLRNVKYISEKEIIKGNTNGKQFISEGSSS